MKIALITAMHSEYNEIKSLLDKGTITTSHTFSVHECGMGKVNAAMVAERLCLEGAEAIISVGIAGGIDGALTQSDTVLSTRLAYHDVWCGVPNQKGQVQDLPLYYESQLFQNVDVAGVKKGLIVTGDQFITDEAQLKQIKADFPEALAVDMESAAIAQVCHQNQVLFGSIRMISDVVGEEYQQQMYENFWETCPNKLAEITKEIIEKL